MRFPCSRFWEAWALTCPCSKGLVSPSVWWDQLSSTTCSGLTFWGSAPCPFLVLRPALERSPGSGSWEGAERRRGNGKAGHPPPEEASRLLRGGGSRAQTQTDRSKHTQTDSDTHRNPHAQRALPFPSGAHLPPRDSPASLWKSSLACCHPACDLMEAAAPHPPHPVAGRSPLLPSWVPGLSAIPGEGSQESPWGGSLPSRRPEGSWRSSHQLRERGGSGRRGGLKGPPWVGPGSGWSDPLWPITTPQRPVLWLGKLVGVVYLTELLTLPSSPSSPEGWPDLSVPGAVVVQGPPRAATPRPRPRPPTPKLAPGCRWGLGCAYDPLTVSSRSWRLWGSLGGRFLRLGA